MDIENKIIMVMNGQDYKILSKAYKKYTAELERSRENNRKKSKTGITKEIQALPEDIDIYVTQYVDGKFYPLNLDLEFKN